MSYVYVLARLKNPLEIKNTDFEWTKNVVDWSPSLDDMKEQLSKIFPSSRDQWEERNSVLEGDLSPYLWSQIPDGPRFEFTVHVKPFPWISIGTTDSEEVARVGRILGLSALDVQSGTWIYIQDT